MGNTDYKPRLIDPMVKEYLETFGALCIEDPKWCGKTWTAQHHAASALSLGDPAGGSLNRQLAKEDPNLILDGVRRDVAKMRLLLRSLARNESTMVSNKALTNDIKAVDDADIDRETVAAYLDVFDRLFLTENQPPYAENLRSSVRVHQTVKRHLADPSLACALLNTTPAALLADLNTLGFLFESLCVRDMRVYADTFGAKLYHYRDYSNREADAVLELEDGRWCAFEIKLGAGQIEAAARSLLKLRDALAADGARPPHVLAVICGMTRAAYRRPDGVFVLPITALRN